MQTFFEATGKQKQMADIGRAMMDWSENYGREFGLKAVTDAGLETLNQMSYVGSLLTQVGAVFGTRMENFSDDDRKLIVDFVNNQVDIDRK